MIIATVVRDRAICFKNEAPSNAVGDQAAQIVKHPEREIVQIEVGGEVLTKWRDKGHPVVWGQDSTGVFAVDIHPTTKAYSVYRLHTVPAGFVVPTQRGFKAN